MGLIAFLLIGLVAGFIARALVPGPDPMGWLGTMVLGIVGSLVGGTLAALLFGGTLEVSAQPGHGHPEPTKAVFYEPLLAGRRAVDKLTRLPDVFYRTSVQHPGALA